MNSGDFVIKNGTLIAYNGRDARVVIPDTVKRIGKGVFNKCDFVTEAVIPDSVKSICSHAFSMCGNLAAVTLPDTDIKIGDGAFKRCLRLADKNGFVILKNTLLDHTGEKSDITVPDNVTVISGFSLWMDRNVKNVYIPDSVTRIGRCAFLWSRSIERIRLPAKLRSIGKEAFECCDGLKEFILPEEASEYVGSVYELLMKSRYINAEVRITAMVSTLKYAADSVVLHPGLRTRLKRNRRSIVSRALSSGNFGVVERLSSLTGRIPLDELEEYMRLSEEDAAATAFLLDYKNRSYTEEECSNQERVWEEKELGLRKRSVAEWKKLYSFIKNEDGSIVITGYRGSQTDIVVPDRIGKGNVVEIGASAFSPKRKGASFRDRRNAEELTSVVIPKTVKRIGISAFECCRSLVSVFVPDSVTSVGASAFGHCERLTSFVLPDSVTYIDRELFFGCERLTDIRLPKGTKHIGNDAFGCCKALVELRIPGLVREIAGFAFSDCIALRRIYIPPSVTSINFFAFDGCRNVTVYGCSGSFAESYARGYKFDFIAVDKDGAKYGFYC